MNKELKIYSALCSTEKFVINGVVADSDDFGDQGDAAQDQAEEYCCGDMTFTPKLPTEDVLKKYSISIKEYADIANELRERLSFGSCGWCS